MSVYFVTCREIGRVKIGHATNARRRFYGLKTGSPLPLALEATTEGGEAEERALHERFSAHRIRGEWFHITPEIDALIHQHKPRGWQQGDRWKGWTYDPEGAARLNARIAAREAAQVAA